MMDCTEYRKSILADPRHPGADMLSHVTVCHDCTEYTEQLLRFESRLDRALQVSVQDIQGTRAAPPRSAPLRPGRPQTARPLRVRRGWLAMAASVLLAALVAGSLWLAVPGPSLAADVVSHMAGEPEAWARTDLPVPEPQLNQVLNESRMRLKSTAGLVSYAHTCLFRGHLVPHLVVQTGAGPVTVMVLTHESLRSAVQFDEQGYRGVIVPVRGHGSLAVLERGPGTDIQAVEGVAARVLDAINWTG
jgi:hypothetical protein